MEKITNYLKYYIGSECSADGNKFTLAAVMDLDGSTSAFTGNFVDEKGTPECWWVENCDFKLYLRPIKHLTPDEKTELQDLLGVLNVGHFIRAYRFESTYSISIHIMTELVNKLRGWGIDMDNLIKKGLAEKTTIKK